MMIALMMIWMDNGNGTGISAMYFIYFLLETYLICVEAKHCQFAFYLYHLLTSIQPLQTNHNIQWDEINVQSIEIVHDVMYQHRGIHDALIDECNVHPNIVQIILLYLVYPLPENGNM